METWKELTEYRPNVAIVLCNKHAQVLWARRMRHDGWQFPQGGVAPNETSHEAAYRELEEELGLKRQHVRLIGSTKEWFTYDIPEQFLRNRYRQGLRGQRQKWFLFEFTGDNSDFCLDCTPHPEFDDWKWIDYWDSVDRVVNFKRAVYRQALTELEPLVSRIIDIQ